MQQKSASAHPTRNPRFTPLGLVAINPKVATNVMDLDQRTVVYSVVASQ